MTREEFIREIIVSLTQKRNLITDIIFDAQTIIKMADDFVAHREFKLNDDVELVAEKRYNEREDIKPSKNAKKYNYTVVWDDKTDEIKDKEEEVVRLTQEIEILEKEKNEISHNHKEIFSKRDQLSERMVLLEKEKLLKLR